MRKAVESRGIKGSRSGGEPNWRTNVCCHTMTTGGPDRTTSSVLGDAARLAGIRGMNILGISGFENSMPFKRAHWPSLDEREYRISQGHDAAAALVVDGEVVAAAAEERFNREKHSARFPLRAIEYCLAEADLALEDVDELAHGFDYQPFEQLFSLDPVASRAVPRSLFSRSTSAPHGAGSPWVPRGARSSCRPSPGPRGECVFHVRVRRMPSRRHRRNGGGRQRDRISRRMQDAWRNFTRSRRPTRSGSCIHS